jgi:hypothetical protein
MSSGFTLPAHASKYVSSASAVALKLLVDVAPLVFGARKYVAPLDHRESLASALVDVQHACVCVADDERGVDTGIAVREFGRCAPVA